MRLMLSVTAIKNGRKNKLDFTDIDHSFFSIIMYNEIIIDSVLELTSKGCK